MRQKQLLSRKSSDRRQRKARRAVLKLVENDLIRRVSFEEYQAKVRHVYGGRQGAFLAACSMISLHVPLGERLFSKRRFDLSGLHSVLDVGSGAGQIAQHLLRYGEPSLTVTCTDLSPQMLRRARHRLARQNLPLRRTRFMTADLSCLPFADASFDCVT
ncbi:MAG TPA: class I SAM-dependent methyltransferase, partial [Pirellulales bacterium]|nr:class I SAM-dependent methyltransferase [Pirellulales bacterium]